MGQIATLRDHRGDRSDPFASIIGSSPAMLDTKRMARRLASCARVPVLIEGETGVGKDVFARALHHASQQPDAPYVAINCGALSRELLASELFGYAEGAFTGARRGGHEGKLAAADGGTLFLDEFGELPKDLQPPLLRALESGEYHRVGENHTRVSRFRLITATNGNLPELVETGQFRRDLYYRAAVTTLTVPPLRDRDTDIIELFNYLQTIVAAEYELPQKTTSPDVHAALMAHRWPGNVRELKNVVIAASLAATTPRIHARDLPPLQHETRSPAEHQSAPTEDLRTLERRAISAALTAQNGNLSGAARALGLAKSTLHAKLKRYGIERNGRTQILSRV